VARAPDKASEVGRILDDAPDPLVAAECVRIARRIRAAELKVVGFVPASDDAAVPPVAIKLGLALVELSGATVAYVDANVHLPAISELSGDADAGGSVFTTRWLRGSLALLTPAKAEAPGLVGAQLERILFDSPELFAHVLVDLTGFEQFGEERIADQMDAVILVARAGRTTEADLLRHRGPRVLGVLLVG
jgi:hypothetical protein